MCNAFIKLNAINVNDHVERKNGLNYLSWAWAWAELKKRYPNSFYTIYENRDGLFYHTDGRTCWVKTGVTVVDESGCLEHIEYLPVMDNRNRSIEVDKVTSFDVNKAIQRSLTKAVARHGLGLYIYASEDLPDGEEKPAPSPLTCSRCGKAITPLKLKSGSEMAPADVAQNTQKLFGKPMCAGCWEDAKRVNG